MTGACVKQSQQESSEPWRWLQLGFRLWSSWRMPGNSWLRQELIKPICRCGMCCCASQRRRCAAVCVGICAEKHGMNLPKTKNFLCFYNQPILLLYKERSKIMFCIEILALCGITQIMMTSYLFKSLRTNMPTKRLRHTVSSPLGMGFWVGFVAYAGVALCPPYIEHSFPLAAEQAEIDKFCAKYTSYEN